MSTIDRYYVITKEQWNNTYGNYETTVYGVVSSYTRALDLKNKLQDLADNQIGLDISYDICPCFNEDDIEEFINLYKTIPNSAIPNRQEYIVN